MTEHVHVWNAMVGDGIFGECADKDCHKVLDWDEVDRRLNAVDKLSAEQATALDDYADHPDPAVKGSGYAYAAALEEG